jgi:hypothetical protein
MSEERIQRRLAAILAADVVGYSRLMQVDEAGTIQLSTSNPSRNWGRRDPRRTGGSWSLEHHLIPGDETQSRRASTGAQKSAQPLRR